MKKLFKIFASISVLAMAASCQQFKIDTQMSDEEYAKHIKLVCSAVEEYNLPAANPQSFTFNVSSNASWTILGTTEWLSVTPSSSSASSLVSDVMVTAQPNLTDSDRSATLVVKNEKYDTGAYTIKINQSRKGELFIQPCARAFTAAGETLPFTVEANYAWKIRTSETWLTLDKNSGEAGEQVVTINATAASNEGLERKAVVTVSCGPVEQTFEVVQKGTPFNIVVPENPTVNRLGGEIVVEINTVIPWTIKGDNEAFKLEKLDATHFKVSAPFNNQFVKRTVKVTAESSIAKDEIEISQDINFILNNCEVLKDGSVKLSGDNGSNFVPKDGLRYFETKVVFGEKSFGTKAQFWVFALSYNGGEMGNWLRIGNNTRFRLKVGSIYKNYAYEVTQAQMNTMTEYNFKYSQNAEDKTKCDLYLGFDGKEIASFTYDSPYSLYPDSAEYLFGIQAKDSDAGWCVVKTCDIINLPENK